MSEGILAGEPGLEPEITVLETVVIPLHYSPVRAMITQMRLQIKRGS